MVAYSFQKRFAEPILSGEKLHTIRADRKRHARPGETTQLYTGMRTKHCRKIADRICTAVLPIMLNFHMDGFAYVGGGYPFLILGEVTDETLFDGLSGRFYVADQEQLARRDGFLSWSQMSAFWSEQHGPCGPAEVFIGKLIGWWPK
jgi:hypothetical protein